MRHLVSAIALSMALAAPAFADDAAPGAAPAPEQGKTKSKDKGGKAAGVVCTSTTPTGSLFPVKVCTTAEQRKSQGNGVRNAQERMQGAAPVIPN
jgi:hypothetical protein